MLNKNKKTMKYIKTLSISWLLILLNMFSLAYAEVVAEDTEETKLTQEWLNKGIKAYQATDLIGAIGWFEKAAEKNNGYAKAMLGNIYVTAGDTERGLKFLLEAESSKEKEALFQLSAFYALGNGVEKDESKALNLIKQASDLGLDEATYALAEVYEYGKLSVEKDELTAFEIYYGLLDKGFEPAAYRLINAFTKGEMGLDKDAEAANEIRKTFIAALNKKAEEKKVSKTEEKQND